jgi:NhaP-type Na+/H+ or K+/H+ antiporter
MYTQTRDCVFLLTRQKPPPHLLTGTVVSSLVAGMGLFSLARSGWLTGISTQSPKEGMQFGTLLSATDTVATIAVLRQMGVDPQLYALIFGESVLNDAVAVVLFQTISTLRSFNFG